MVVRLVEQMAKHCLAFDERSPSQTRPLSSNRSKHHAHRSPIAPSIKALKSGLPSLSHTTISASIMAEVAGRLSRLARIAWEPPCVVVPVTREYRDLIASLVQLSTPAVEPDLMKPLRPRGRLALQDWCGRYDEGVSLEHGQDLGSACRKIKRGPAEASLGWTNPRHRQSELRRTGFDGPLKESATSI